MLGERNRMFKGVMYDRLRARAAARARTGNPSGRVNDSLVEK